MKNHQSLMIARSGPARFHLAGISTKQLVERYVDVNMLVFLRTLDRILSRELESLSSSDAFFSTLCGAAVSLLRSCSAARRAIHEFHDSRCSFASERHLPARYVSAAK